MSTKIANLRGSRLGPIYRRSVLEAGGKPSTRLPPGGLVELTFNARSMRMISYGFLFENLEFRKIIKK